MKVSFIVRFFMRTLSLQYQLSVKSWQQHLFAVELKVPEHNEATLTFALPSWIPAVI